MYGCMDILEKKAKCTQNDGVPFQKRKILITVQNVRRLNTTKNYAKLRQRIDQYIATTATYF